VADERRVRAYKDVVVRPFFAIHFRGDVGGSVDALAAFNSARNALSNRGGAGGEFGCSGSGAARCSAVVPARGRPDIVRRHPRRTAHSSHDVRGGSGLRRTVKGLSPSERTLAMIST